MIDFPHKIVVPRRPRELVSRSRLTTVIEHIVERRLLVVVAPAGYGKTSLLIDFVTSTPAMPICWYALDRFDEDPWVFLGYLTGAVTQQFPGALQQTQHLLASAAPLPLATVAASFIREVYAITQDFVLVIDDWHHVDHVESCAELVEKLLLYCPRCHVILATRSFPGLSDLMVLANQRQFIGLDEEHLRFSASEVAAVLEQGYQLDLPATHLDTLVAQSAGWITGVLLALQVTSPSLRAEPIVDTRALRHVYRYLAEQVLGQQSAEVQTFLLDASLLEELTPQRCTHWLSYPDASTLLDRLTRQHLFVTEIRPGVLRFHPLFREFLQEQFRTRDPVRFNALARHVAAIYLAQQQWQLAFDTYMLADDRAGAQGVVAQGGAALYANGRLETLERWFNFLPLDDLDVPLLCLKARLLLERGQSHKAHVLATMAAVRMTAAEQPVVLLLQAQIAHIMGNYDQAIDHAQQVLHTTYDAAERAIALRTLAICHQRQHATAQAIEELNQALNIQRQRGDLEALAQLHHDLGVCYEHLGVLRVAEDYYSYADAHWATIGNRGLQAMSLNSKGVVQHMAGRFREAHATLNVALAYAEEASLPRYQATIHVSIGDLLSDLQAWADAEAAYDRATQLGCSAYMANYLYVARVRLLARQRLYDSAARALERWSDTANAPHWHAVLLLRAQIASGQGAFEEAVSIINQAIDLFQRTQSHMDLARAYVLQGHVLARTQPAAPQRFIEAFEQARRIAERLGHDSFLIIDTLALRQSVRQAYAAGWEPGNSWLQRYQALEVETQAIDVDTTRPLVTIRSFATDMIAVDGQWIDLGWLKAREVLHYLLLHPDGATTDTLREAIWPHLTPEGSRSTLKNAIYQLRARLPHGTIELHGRQTYRLNTAAVRLDYDVQRFLQRSDTSSINLEQCLDALDLYRGPLLPQCDSEWCHQTRSMLHQRYLQMLRLVAHECEHTGAYWDALQQWQRYLLDEPLDEMAHAAVMRCHLAVGNRAAAVQQYQTLRRLLDQELGLELGTDSEVERLYYQLLHVN
jgi:LuxR family transcriptional regulator, maltose regulon positive regulatory protein